LYADGKADKLPKESKKKKKKKKDWDLRNNPVFREAEHKFTAPSRSAFYYQLSLVPIGNVLNDGQSQTCATRIPWATSINPIETLG
jgi:hypothetical protein